MQQCHDAAISQRRPGSLNAGQRCPQSARVAPLQPRTQRSDPKSALSILGK